MAYDYHRHHVRRFEAGPSESDETVLNSYGMFDAVAIEPAADLDAGVSAVQDRAA
jgi:hypothetical protein